MTMYTVADGALTPIPDDHEKVLAQYRDSMPLVYEPQYCGDPYLYPLIDVDEEPYGTPQPGELERAARQVAHRLKAQRLDQNPQTPDYGRLAGAALRAHIADMADFAAAVANDDGPKAIERAVVEETTRASRKLKRAIEKAVRDAVASFSKEVAA
ncbi:hypothetical protein [Streptomyces noursei]|uniref:hypothetical protein n=1 Tax=Streptomyces noursei TaxID=1971 RepID=UPI0035E0510E